MKSIIKLFYFINFISHQNPAFTIQIYNECLNNYDGKNSQNDINNLLNKLKPDPLKIYEFH